jgi:signal transduction histidine kinase
MKNITETKKLKNLLYHSDKLASLGLLVGGVAHEINNPLTGIIGYAELLKIKPHPGDIDAELNKILEGAERCRKIVENLLTFSRQKAPAKNVASINSILDKTIDLRSYWIRTNAIEIVREYGEPSTVFADAQQIQLVILNILLNAEQAINETGRTKGRIVFNTQYDPETRQIMIRISDNGAGISQDKLPKIFNPFYTTKPVGTGTGLGLSISHSIVTEHGGKIWVESVEGKGSTLALTLPTSADAVHPPRVLENTPVST